MDRSYQLNINASFFEDGTSSLVAIVQNSHGEALDGVTKTFDHVANAASVEALTLCRDLQLIQQIEYSWIVIESSCLEVIVAYNGVSDILAPYYAILADCFHFEHDITSTCFQHCPRKANALAHNLDRHAYGSQLMYWWDDEPPSFLLPHVLQDVTRLNSQ